MAQFTDFSAIAKNLKNALSEDIKEASHLCIEDLIQRHNKKETNLESAFSTCKAIIAENNRRHFESYPKLAKSVELTQARLASDAQKK